MKNNKNLLIIAGLAALLGLFLYLSKKKEDTKRSGNQVYQANSTSGGSATRGVRNKNPFNIRYNGITKWKGLAGSDGSFCIFEDMKYGIRAGGVLLRNYLKKGNNTIEKIIKKFAPAADGNNTADYIKHVAQMSGINQTAVLSNSDLWTVARPMMYIESRYNATENDKNYFNNQNI